MHFPVLVDINSTATIFHCKEENVHDQTKKNIYTALFSLPGLDLSARFR